MDIDRLQQEIAQTAARLIVEDGLDFASARRKAMQEHGEGRRLRDAPGNEAIEDEVRAYIDLFHADTQPAELRALRETALRWMLRLQEFRPHLSGATWRGTATRQSVVRIDLYCDDTKAPEIALLNKGIEYETVSEPLGRGEHSLTLVLAERNAALGDDRRAHGRCRPAELTARHVPLAASDRVPTPAFPQCRTQAGSPATCHDGAMTRPRGHTNTTWNWTGNSWKWRRPPRA